MKHFYLKSIILCLFLLIIKEGYCRTVVQKNGIYYELQDTRAFVTYYSSYEEENREYYKGNIVIPKTISVYDRNLGRDKNYNVTLIGVNAFSGCADLKSITIPDGIIIASYAFRNCSGLSTINIPEGDISIGEGVFEGCSSLSEVTIPSSVTYIYKYAFDGCTNLSSINIPSSINSIYDYAFRGCSSLKNIVIPSNLTNIVDNAFQNCYGIESITVEASNDKYDSRNNCNAVISTKDNSILIGCKNTIMQTNITAISDYAFYGCKDLKRITISKNLSKIGDHSFEGCTGLDTVIIDNNTYVLDNNSCSSIFGEQVKEYILGNNVTSIGRSAFAGCNARSIIISNSVLDIEPFSFAQCINLSNVVLPNNLSSLKNNLFYGCSNLKNIIIPNSITSIGNEAFYGCGLNSIEIPFGVKTIGNRTFEDCKNLTDVIIANSVNEIGYSIFAGCRMLNSILIPASVKSIGNNAFFGCDNLNKVIIPDIASWCRIEFEDDGNSESISNPLSIAHHIYSDKDTEIVDLVIPNGVDSIKENVFYGCSNLKSVKIPNTVKYIGKESFSGCTGMNKVIVPDIVSWCGIDFLTDNNWWNPTISNPLSIAHHIYSDENTEITDLVIPEGVERINDGVFFGASSLKSVSIPSSIKSIGSIAFYNCLGLEKVIVPDLAAWCNIEFGDNPLSLAGHLYSDSDTEITDLKIPASVKKINGYTFMGANSLTSLSVPNSVMTIGDGAFFGCSKIKSLVIPNGLQTIGEYAFSKCSGLETLVIPNSVKTIGYNAFADCMSLYSVTSLINMPFKLNESAFKYTGEDYNTDVIYMAATLYVPRGKMAMYKMTEGWMKFINVAEIDTKFKLTYMLDGEEYKTYEIQAAEVITPEPDPYKEGYIFSGWSNIPYLMPAQDVTVTGSFSIDPGYQAGIGATKTSEAVPETYYSPEGRRLDAPQRGINIIRMSNGTTKKVFVK